MGYLPRSNPSFRGDLFNGLLTISYYHFFTILSFHLGNEEKHATKLWLSPLRFIAILPLSQGQ
jgi:hypothetical protein